ncbi:uncharacterized protein [Haliotis asinina]|uniref:uncharacterized protein isoform X1 n=1 Tax=Haliotis asinina TaxID=109174 RepID=UPI003531E896
MRKDGRGWSVTFTLLVLILHEVKASGKLDLKFHSYFSSGKGSNGNCCESIVSWLGCGNQCDPKFTLCVDESDSHSIHDCSLLKKATGVVHEKNNIVFGTDIGGTSNRFVIPVTTIPSKVKVKVEVYDDDPGTGDDHMDNLQKVLEGFVVSPKAEESLYETFTLAHRTTLKIQFRAYCDPDWYGSVCEIYCKAQNDESGHYTCHEHTGQKICNMGWMGDNCEQNIDECQAGGYCQNSAVCEDLPGSFKCKCRDGFGGMFCQDITHQCATDPCVNGGVCSGNETTFNCTCPIGWSGDTCAVEVDPCESNPCERGTCLSNNVTATRFSCSCESGWKGTLCEVDIVEAIPTDGDPAAITLLGVIDDSNRDNLTNGLIKLIQNLGGVPETVYVKVNTRTIPINSEITTTRVEFYSSLADGTVLDNEAVNRIFTTNDDDDINPYLPLPLYPPRPKSGTLGLTEVEVRKKSWLTSNWYAIVLPLLIAVILVILLAIILIRRRRSDKSKELMRCESNVMDAEPNHMAFENVLYREANKENMQRQDNDQAFDGEPTANGVLATGGACSDEANPYCQPVQYDTLPKQPNTLCNSAGQYENSNLATLDTRCEAGANDYTDFNDLEGDKAGAENHYQELDEVLQQKAAIAAGDGAGGDVSDVSAGNSDIEDDIDKIKEEIRKTYSEA